MITIKRPVLITLFGAIVGIICGLYFKTSIATIIILLSLLLFLIQKFRDKESSLNNFFTFLNKQRKVILLFLISAIIFNLYINQLNNKYTEFYKKVPKEIETTATIISEAKETEYYYSYQIKINEKKFILYVKKNHQEKLKYGMYINVKAEYIEPAESRNYKGFNYKEYLKSQKIYGSLKAEEIEVIQENKIGYLLQISNNIRNKIIETARNILPKETSNLLVGILIGERDDIPEEITENFSKSSLSHILAISGSHIAYIIMGITFILDRSKIPKKGTHIITIFSLIIFMFITRFSPSVVRACIMGIIMLFAKVVYRKQDTINSIAISLLIILSYNPFSIRDLGLQLSYLGALGIIFLNKPITKFLEKHTCKKIAGIIATTISAQIMVLPVTVLNFNNISTLFIISNIIAVPLSGAIILVGYANIFIGMVSLKIAKVIAIFTHSLVKLLINTAKLIGNIPYSNIIVITPTTIVIILYYMGIVGFLLWTRLDFRIKRYIKAQRKNVLICISVSIILFTICVNIVPKDFNIYFVDVGQRRLYIDKYTRREKHLSRYRRGRKCCS